MVDTFTVDTVRLEPNREENKVDPTFKVDTAILDTTILDPNMVEKTVELA